jgi:hypothetical protein
MEMLGLSELFCIVDIFLLATFGEVRFSNFALNFQIACVFDNLRLSEFLSLSASIASFGTFAISPDALVFDFSGSFPLAFDLASLIALVAFPFAFDIFSFISCSCVSTSSDFYGIRRPHLPFVFAFDLFGCVHSPSIATALFR